MGKIRVVIASISGSLAKPESRLLSFFVRELVCQIVADR